MNIHIKKFSKTTERKKYIENSVTLENNKRWDFIKALRDS